MPDAVEKGEGRRAFELFDGTLLDGPEDLRAALLRRPEALVRNFVVNLMTYALGRRIEAADQSTVRAIERAAADDGYRVRALIHGVVASDAFQMSRAEAP